jgi:hypothetical protein
MRFISAVSQAKKISAECQESLHYEVEETQPVFGS